ncbi:MAG: glycosyltransferase [Ilumatobacteraceae bacterium]
MTILLVTKGLDLGGTERVVTDLAVHLAGRGLQVEVALINARRAAMLPTLRAAEVTVHALPGNDRVGIRGLIALRRLQRSRRFDVVHAHGPLPIVASRLVARSRVVGTLHSMWPSLRRPSRMAVRVMGGLPLIAVSEAVCASLPPALRRRATVIGHGVDLESAAAARRAAGHRATRDGDVQLVAVASHRHAKNYGNLLQAVALARQAGAAVRLRAIGEGPRLEHDRRLAEQLGIACYVDFDPPCVDVLREIAASDIFVLASDTEGQPIVLIEALATGVPVIATRVGRAPELLTSQVGVLVPPGDPNRLATEIVSLAADPARRAAMGAAGVQVARGCSLIAVVDAHVQRYQEVLR